MRAWGARSYRVTFAVLALSAVSVVVAPAADTKDHRPVLGSKRFDAPNAEGFGRVKPETIFNGGDPSGLVTKIRWTRWGGRTALGYGLNAIVQPGGGYYPQLVRIDLKPAAIGRCTNHGRLTYRRLYVREPTRPGGPMGDWFLWSGAHNLCHAFSG
jgi:hypothetical protein